MMRFPVFRALLALSCALTPATALAQATVTTFLGNGQAPDGAFSGRVGNDVGGLPVEPQHLAVDQAGNVFVNVGSAVIRVSRSRILQGQNTGLGAFNLRGIASDPFGRVAAIGTHCLFVGTPPANGFTLTQTYGNCIFTPADGGDGTSNPRFLSTASIGVDRQGVVYVWDETASRVRAIGNDGIVRAVNSSVRLDGSIAVMPANGESGVITCDLNGNPVRVQTTGISSFPLPDFFCGHPFTFDLDDNLYHFRLSDSQLVRRTPGGAVSLTGLGLRGQTPFREGMFASDLDIGGDLQRSSIAADTAGNIYFTRGRSRNVFADPLNWRVLRIRLSSAERPDCTFTASPSTPIPASGGRIPIAVRPNAEGCYWQITSQDPWIRVPASASTTQRGARSVELEFEANSGGNRTGAILINGQQIPVTQAGSGAPVNADSGVITSFAGRPDVFGGLTSLPADVSSLLLSFPSDIAFDSTGNAFIVEQGRYRVLQVTPSGGVRVVAGTGLITYAPQSGGPAAQTVLSFPFGATVDNNNRVNITENYILRRFAPGGSIETFVQYLATPASPSGVGLNDLARWDRYQNRMLITYRVNNASSQILSVRGSERTLLNRGSGPSSPDGTPLEEASLSVAFAIGGPDGAIYISESGANRIRRAMPGGRLETIAGTGQAASTGDGGPATDAALCNPAGMVFDSLGNLYVAEAGGHRIRRIRTDGVIETVAGNGQNRSSGDGGSPLTASIFEPTMLTMDPAGNLYVTQRRTHVIRKIVLPRQRPSISVSGLTSAAGTRAFAPGAMFTLRGVNMTSATAASEVPPLPRSLGGVQVLINGIAVPLESVSPGSIRGQIPFEVEPGEATLRVESGGNLTNEITVEILPAAPGILTHADGRAVATNEDGSPNSEEAPAEAGSILTVTLTGIGLVDPMVETGEAAPADPPAAAVIQATATVGDVPAVVEFVGLVPGMVGIAHARLVPSAELPSGNHPVRITMNGVSSNAPTVSIRARN